MEKGALAAEKESTGQEGKSIQAGHDIEAMSLISNVDYGRNIEMSKHNSWELKKYLLSTALESRSEC